jgi:hypothetical protein
MSDIKTAGLVLALTVSGMLSVAGMGIPGMDAGALVTAMFRFVAGVL